MSVSPSLFNGVFMEDLGGIGDPFATVGGGFNSINYAEMNKGVTPIFFIEPIKDGAASEKAGRPVFIEQERVRIIVAGDMYNQIVHPVDDAIKQRFAEQYARWQANKQVRVIDGTPIREWSPLTKAQVAEFEAMGIFSVENLRDMSDLNVSRLPEGREWREKARAWLEAATAGANDMRLAAENERMRSEIERLKQQMAELAANMGEDAPKRGPGRPPKQAA